MIFYTLYIVNLFLKCTVPHTNKHPVLRSPVHSALPVGFLIIPFSSVLASFVRYVFHHLHRVGQCFILLCLMQVCKRQTGLDVDAAGAPLRQRVPRLEGAATSAKRQVRPAYAFGHAL